MIETMTDKNTVLEAIHKLPDDISLQQIVENLELLAMQLNGDTQEDIDAAWEAEINERVRQYKAGETQSFDGEEVLAEARRLCKK